MKNYIEMIRKQDDLLVVDLIFKYPDPFFEPFDPLPLRKRELSNEAEKAMTDAIYDEPQRKPFYTGLGFQRSLPSLIWKNTFPRPLIIISCTESMVPKEISGPHA